MNPANLLTGFYALLGMSPTAPAVLTHLDVLDWGRTLVFAGTVGVQPFMLRYTDCRELRWRVYVQDNPGSTRLVSFAPGRDQQRSPAQFLTEHFGLSLYYGNMSIDSP